MRPVISAGSTFPDYEFGESDWPQATPVRTTTRRSNDPASIVRSLLTKRERGRYATLFTSIPR
jgi:hypothetical protein